MADTFENENMNAEDIDYKIKTAAAIINQKLDPNKTGQIYGTLDVSTCSKNKMSHYKPAETIPTTEPSTTVPADGADSVANDWGGADDYGTYDWSASANDGYDYGNNNTDGGGYDGGGYDGGGYDGGTADDGGGYDGGDGASSAGDGGGYDGYNGGDLGGAGADGATPY